MRKIVVALVCATGFASGAVAQSLLLGPKGEFKTNFIGSRLEYDPSKGCYKPTRPFNNDKFSWDLYAQEGERYLDCLQSASNSDLKYAQAVVQEGYETATQDFLNEVKRGY